MIDTVINDRYRMEAELGQGGMGIVYRAHDVLLDRPVAIKILSESSKVRLGTEGRARLLHEAKTAARMNHPNIVAIYDAGEAGGLPYIVMELIEGSSLYENKPQSETEIVRIARQVCIALAHAHAHGLVHRDLKPENIIVSGAGQVKLTDFGLARSLTSRITSDGMIVGTVLYMAPEVAMRQSVDGRADLYSLGVILYELVTGSLPFYADDPLAVISQHLYSPVVPPHARRPDIPKELDELIMRLLEKQPESRPGSALDVKLALESLDVQLQPILLEQDGPAAAVMLDRIVRGRLVGREIELAEMKSIWYRAAGGEGRVLLVSGEPGIGKTRLVRELLAQAGVSGSTILAGSCYAEGGMAYSPFPSLISETFQSHPEGFGLSDFIMAELITIAPDLRAMFPDVSMHPPIDAHTEQQHVFESVAAWLSALAAKSPVLLFIDDVHWADASSLFLLRHLARRMSRERFLIVLTYREVELSDSNSLQSVLYDLNRERLSTRIKLTRFDREQTRAMLDAMLTPKGQIEESLVEAIYRETEGNPFFIEEVTKTLIEEGKLCFEDICWISKNGDEVNIPQSVRITIQNRLARLPEQAQEVLRLAAIYGRQFDFQVIKAAGNLDEEVIIDALESAERAQLINEISSSKISNPIFSFAHALIPSTLKESTSSLRRQRLHRRVAEAIEIVYPPANSPLESLAYHFENAGDSDRAQHYYARAADRALSVYANQEAERYYRQALEIESDDTPKENLLSGLADAVFRQSRYSEALKTWLEAIELYRDRKDHDKISILYARAARAAWYTGDTPGSLALCQKGLADVEAMNIPPEKIETPGWAALLHETARAYRFNHQEENALELCHKVLDMSRNLGLIEVQAETLATLGILFNRPPEEREKNLREAVDLAEEGGLLATAARAHVNLSGLMRDKIELADSRTHILRAFELAQRMGIASWQHNFLGSAIDLFLEQGDFRAAREGLQTLQDLRRMIHEAETALFFARIMEAKYNRFQGNLKEALQILQLALEDDSSKTDNEKKEDIFPIMVEIYLELGDLDKARNLFEAFTAIEIGQDNGSRFYHQFLLVCLLVLEGNFDQAHRGIDELKEIAASTKPSPREEILVQIASARLASAEKRWDDAFSHYKTAVSDLERHQLIWYHAYYLAEWAGVYLAQGSSGDLEHSRWIFKKARDIFAKLEIPYYTSQIDEWLDKA